MKEDFAGFVYIPMLYSLKLVYSHDGLEQKLMQGKVGIEADFIKIVVTGEAFTGSGKFVPRLTCI